MGASGDETNLSYFYMYLCTYVNSDQKQPNGRNELRPGGHWDRRSQPQLDAIAVQVQRWTKGDPSAKLVGVDSDLCRAAQEMNAFQMPS